MFTWLVCLFFLLFFYEEIGFTANAKILMQVSPSTAKISCMLYAQQIFSATF